MEGLRGGGELDYELPVDVAETRGESSLEHLLLGRAVCHWPGAGDGEPVETVEPSEGRPGVAGGGAFFFCGEGGGCLVG